MSSTPTPYNRALDLLAGRSYTVKELRRKLTQKAIPPEEIDTVIARLLDNGLLDDTRYAFAFARSKLMGSGASPRRVKQELLRKGIPGDIADNAIAQVIRDEEIDPRASLERVARKKLTQLGDLPPLTLRRRLYSFLARRGYDLDDIQSVVSTLLSSDSPAH
jgi:regulatory protein